VLELRDPDLPPEDLVKLCERTHEAKSESSPSGAMPFAPQYGYALLFAEADVDAALDQVAPDVDLQIGSTDSEASLFLPFLPFISTVIQIPFLDRSIHDIAVSKVTHISYRPFDERFTKRHARAGGKASLYCIHWNNRNNRFGATHTTKLPLLFGDEDVYGSAGVIKGFEPSEVEVAGAQMRMIWANFAKGKQLGITVSIDCLIPAEQV
jgi:para-nitrobenzyl esterase